LSKLARGTVVKDLTMRRDKLIFFSFLQKRKNNSFSKKDGAKASSPIR
jgi:hypothetical protein